MCQRVASSACVRELVDSHILLDQKVDWKAVCVFSIEWSRPRGVA